jgi:hypothetical protein
MKDLRIFSQRPGSSRAVVGVGFGLFSDSLRTPPGFRGGSPNKNRERSLFLAVGTDDTARSPRRRVRPPPDVSISAE